MTPAEPHVALRAVTLAYGDTLIQRDLTFGVRRGDVFIIMGGSGCGKSTVMNALVGLLEPAAGEILYAGESFWGAPPERTLAMKRRFGVMFQDGALWSSMTLAENVALPLEEYTDLAPPQIRDLAQFKLALVGLRGFEDYYPSQVSGGMRKRVGVARAMALDPEILFFDEPSAGLDPLSARLMDDLITGLRDSLGTTMVVVTHELASIFAIADDAVFLDPHEKTMIATGAPTALRDASPDPRVRAFLTRGES